MPRATWEAEHPAGSGDAGIRRTVVIREDRVAAYLIVDIEVKDGAGYEEYKRMASETIRAFGGKYLVRGGAAEVLEGDWKPGRLVVLEFPGVERARAWWSSEEYRKAREIRLRTAGCRMLLVEGV